MKKIARMPLETGAFRLLGHLHKQQDMQEETRRMKAINKAYRRQYPQKSLLKQYLGTKQASVMGRAAKALLEG